MKRFWSLLTVSALLMTVLLCGCGEEEPKTATITRGDASDIRSTTTTTFATTTTEKPTASTTVKTDATGGTVKPTTTKPTTKPSVVVDSGESEVGTAIAELAVSLIGSPYQRGGTGPAAFDNPGFVTYCYKQSGLTVSRTLSSVMSFGVAASAEALQPGDILLFCENESGNPTFAGIYIGGSRFVACKNADSGTVDIALNNTYWLPRLIAVRRAG